MTTVLRDEVIERFLAVFKAPTDGARAALMAEAVDALAALRAPVPEASVRLTPTDVRIANLRAALASIAGGQPAEEVEDEDDLRERLHWCQTAAETALVDDERVGA